MAEFDLYVNDHGAPSGDGKKKLVINAAVCDARDVTGETLQAYSGVTINAATILTKAKTDLRHLLPVQVLSAVFWTRSAGTAGRTARRSRA